MKNCIQKGFVRAFCIVSFILSFSALNAADRGGGGFFLGGELGYSVVFQTTNQVPSVSTTNFPYGNVGLKFGYIGSLSEKIALRGYASYNYGFLSSSEDTAADGTNPASSTSSSASLHQFTGNIDVIFKLADSFGVYAGVGAGYASANTTSVTDNVSTTTNVASGFVLPVNVGVEAYMGSNHIASLNFKIPTIAYKGTDTAAVTTEMRNLIITLGYSYKF